MARGKRNQGTKMYTIWYDDGVVATQLYTQRPGVAVACAKGISRARKSVDVILAQTSDVGHGRIAYDETLVYRNGKFIGREKYERY